MEAALAAAAENEGGYDDDFEDEGQEKHPMAPAGPPPRDRDSRPQSAREILQASAIKAEQQAIAEAHADNSLRNAIKSVDSSLDAANPESAKLRKELGLDQQKEEENNGANYNAMLDGSSSEDEDDGDHDERTNMELIFAAFHGRMNDLNRCLDRGAKATFQDKHGWTPLHHAAANGHTSVVRELLDSLATDKRRARLVHKAETWCGFTALHVAVAGNHVETSDVLVNRYKADVHRPNLVGDTPRDCIILKGRKGREMAAILGVKLKPRKGYGNEGKHDDGDEGKEESKGGESKS